MKTRMLSVLLIACMLLGLLCACGSAPEAAAESAAAASASAEAAPAEPEAPEAPEAPEEAAPASVAEEAPEAEASAEAPAEPEAPEEPEEPEAPAEPVVATITFSTGEVFEATVGEDFIFFFQCDAPGDMGEPNEGEEGAGITVSDGTVTYSDVGTGGPYSYPTSEKVTISGFTGDVEVTVCEAATNMDATHTIYIDPQEIEDAVAFNAEMAAQRANNPMPGGDPGAGAGGEGAPGDAPPEGAPPA